MPEDTFPGTPVTRRRFLMMLGGAGALAGAGLLEGLGTRGAFAAAGGLQAVGRTSRALGTEVSMTVLHARREVAEESLTAAFAELERVDHLMSLYRPDSQLCRLNREGSLTRPDPSLVTVLRKARAVAERTGGAFDVTVQPLWEVYAAAQKAGRVAEAKAVAAVLPRVDWRRVEVTPERVRLTGEGTAITLNGIAQGYAADRVVGALRARGIRHALVNTGEIGTLGTKADGQPWVVGIQHPRQANAYVGAARLEGCCLATSGDYATSFSADHAYNHLFDPSTGRSPESFSSVTVLAPTGIDADALSTALYVLGYEKALSLVHSLPGIEAFFVLKSGEVRATPGFPQAA